MKSLTRATIVSNTLKNLQFPVITGSGSGSGSGFGSVSMLSIRPQRDYLIYDHMQARTDILHWKAHNLRSINQEAAKQNQLEMITNNPNYALIVMDWAMKFYNSNIARSIQIGMVKED